MARLIKPGALSSLNRYRTIDASWFMPNSPKVGHQEYLAHRLPGARFFDLDGVTTESPYPHMMPSKETFDHAIGSLGIRPDDTLVIYDQGDLLSSPRVYWMFETFGHKDLYLLDNWSDYVAENNPVEDGEPKTVEPTAYTSPSVGKWVLFEELQALVENGLKDHVLLDARPAGRFFGKSPEPRAGLSNGHVPGAKSLPADEVRKEGHFVSSDTVKKLLQERNIDTTKQVICMCGSGVTACIIKYSIDPHLSKPALIYDGSWTEWVQRSSLIEDASN